MGIFRKRSDSMDVIDLPMLEKRGLIKIPKRKNSGLKSRDGFLDFTDARAENIALSRLTNSSSSSSAGSSGSPFNFLDSLAGAGNTGNSLSSSSSGDSSGLNELKIKIEDLEYKLGRLLERIESMDSKMRESGR